MIRAAVMGLDCRDPHEVANVLRGLPPVDLLLLPELAFMPWLCASLPVDGAAWGRAVAEQPLSVLTETHGSGTTRTNTATTMCT